MVLLPTSMVTTAECVQLATDVFGCGRVERGVVFFWLRRGCRNFEESSYQEVHFIAVETREVQYTSSYLGAPGSM